ncbi:hypothetical protein V2G26_012107 [Clonostachys chloroleuca]
MAGGSSFHLLIVRYRLLLLLLLCPFVLAKLALEEYPEYVTRHAPLVWLHSQDPFRPSDILGHIQRTTPSLDGKPISGLPLLDLDNLEVLNQYGDEVALTSNDNPLSRPAWMLGETPDHDGKLRSAIASVVVLVENRFMDFDAFYFYFYSFDQGPNITQVVKPLNSLISGSKSDIDMHFGNHVGDWEHNMVRFRDGRPVGVYYSQHRDGRAYDWDEPELSKVDERPVVYSAYGSHANYAKPGEHIHDIALIDFCDEGPKWDPIQSAYFYHLDTTSFTLTRLKPPNQTSPSPPSNFTSFFYYKGLWGDAKYPDSDPRQKVLPKFGFRRFVSGPNGPRFKDLIRHGLMPDRPRKKTWAEFGVKVFMSLYPVLFKDWRKWVSLVFVVILCVGVGLITRRLIRLTVTKYRKRQDYKKLQQENEVLLDDWRTDEEAQLFSDDEEHTERI